jgi:hypothetical protein
MKIPPHRKPRIWSKKNPSTLSPPFFPHSTDYTHKKSHPDRHSKLPKKFKCFSLELPVLHFLQIALIPFPNTSPAPLKSVPLVRTSLRNVAFPIISPVPLTVKLSVTFPVFIVGNCPPHHFVVSLLVRSVKLLLDHKLELVWYFRIRIVLGIVPFQNSGIVTQHLDIHSEQQLFSLYFLEDLVPIGFISVMLQRDL